jgi:hypothetical protein
MRHGAVWRPRLGTQLWLQRVAYNHDAVLIDYEGDMLELEADHRQHAVRHPLPQVWAGAQPHAEWQVRANAAWLALL